MRTTHDFMNEVIKRARHRNVGDTFAISEIEWPELINAIWRDEVQSTIMNMEYIPFRTVRFVHDRGKWAFIATVRPGAELVTDHSPPDPPSRWNWIKRIFTGS